jgi:hypothetical protein
VKPRAQTSYSAATTAARCNLRDTESGPRCMRSHAARSVCGLYCFYTSHTILAAVRYDLPLRPALMHLHQRAHTTVVGRCLPYSDCQRNNRSASRSHMHLSAYVTSRILQTADGCISRACEHHRRRWLLLSSFFTQLRKSRTLRSVGGIVVSHFIIDGLATAWYCICNKVAYVLFLFFSFTESTSSCIQQY